MKKFVLHAINPPAFSRQGALVLRDYLASALAYLVHSGMIFIILESLHDFTLHNTEANLGRAAIIGLLKLAADLARQYNSGKTANV